MFDVHLLLDEFWVRSDPLEELPAGVSDGFMEKLSMSRQIPIAQCLYPLRQWRGFPVKMLLGFCDVWNQITCREKGIAELQKTLCLQHFRRDSYYARLSSEDRSNDPD